MNSFRSIIPAILLVVMAAQMVLPIYSHHWFNAARWRTHTILEVGQRPNTAAQPNTLPQGHAVVRSGEFTSAKSAPVAKPTLLVIANSVGESLLFLGLQFIWVGTEIRFDLFNPRHWVFQIAPPPHRDIHLPPERIPPQSARLITQF